jgi:hypothetical protein
VTKKWRFTARLRDRIGLCDFRLFVFGCHTFFDFAFPLTAQSAIGSVILLDRATFAVMDKLVVKLDQMHGLLMPGRGI